MEKKKRAFRGDVKRMFSPVKKNPGIFFRAVLQPAVRACFDIYLIWLFKEIAQIVQYNSDPQQIKNILFQLAIVIFFYYIWKWFTRNFGWVQMNYRQPMIIWKEYFPKFFMLEPTYVEKIGTGKSMNILKEGVDNWADILMGPIPQLIDIVIKFIFSCYIIWQIGWIYSITFIVAFIGMQFFVVYMNNYAIGRRKKRKEAESNIMRQIVRMIMSKQEILQNERIEQEIGLLESNSMEAHTYNIRVNTFLRIMFNVPLLLTHLVSVLTLVYAYFSLTNGSFSFGLFAALISLAGFLNSSVLASTGNFKELTGYFTHVDRLRNFIDNAPSLEQYEKGKKFMFKEGNISFENISFAYEDSNVFEKFSLDIQGGKKTALVGVSGGGKSTIIKLIAGYIRPDKGEMIIDDQKLSKISLKSYYKHIGYLTQEPSIFDGTIYENLIYALEQPPMQEALDSAVQQAQCQFIYEFKDGLQTEIGEKGIRLSGGQRQRLAIAKIFLKNPEIVLLDEPTSALDSLSEEAITKAMHNLFQGRTVIIIAHRLQTVKHADDIIVVEAGKVIERGTHQELIKMGGHYAKMLELQSGF